MRAEAGLYLLLPPRATVSAWKPAAVDPFAGDARASCSRANGTNRGGQGETPVGVLTYDSRGRMSAQLMRRNRPAFKAADLFRGSPDEIKAAFEGFVAYFGTYTVDQRTSTVTHHVEGSSFPNYVGTDLKRSFTIVGDRLTLRTEPFTLGGETRMGVLVWERID